MKNAKLLARHILEITSAQGLLTEQHKALQIQKERVLLLAGYTKVRDPDPWYVCRRRVRWIFIPPGCRLLPPHVPEGKTYTSSTALADDKGQAYQLVITWGQFVTRAVKVERMKLLAYAGCASHRLGLGKLAHRKDCPNA